MINTRIVFAAMLAITLLVVVVPVSGQTTLFQCTDGVVILKSDATLELIQAKSHKLRGLIDPAKQTFAWAVEISTFQGFNSPLQREHFHENYLETERFPRASFSGKIIEKFNIDQPGVQIVRAKGKLSIHGVEQERIIKSQLENKGGKLYITASFTVPIVEHDITIPKIVHQKIAEEIQVTIEAVLQKQ
jgi:hypothetical protein